MLKSVDSMDSTRWNVRMRRVGSSRVIDIDASLKDGAYPSNKYDPSVNFNCENSLTAMMRM